MTHPVYYPVRLMVLIIGDEDGSFSSLPLISTLMHAHLKVARTKRTKLILCCSSSAATLFQNTSMANILLTSTCSISWNQMHSELHHLVHLASVYPWLCKYNGTCMCTIIASTSSVPVRITIQPLYEHKCSILMPCVISHF